MDEQVQGKALEIITSLQETVSKAGSFAMEQLPDIAQQYVMYGRVTTLVETLVWAIMGVILLAAAYRVGRKPWLDRHGQTRDESVIAIVVGGLLGVASMLRAINTFNWLVWVAPKVWLIKELATVLK